MSAKARSLHARVYADAEEAELRVAESGARTADQWDRGHDLHSRGWPQPPGALDCADPRRPCEGSAGRALSRDSRHAGCGGRGRPPARTIEIRRQAREEGLKAECLVKDIHPSGPCQPMPFTARIW